MQQLTWSILVQVIACCLMAPSHNLHQYWLIFIIKIPGKMSPCNFCWNIIDINPKSVFENDVFSGGNMFIPCCFLRRQYVYTLLFSCPPTSVSTDWLTWAVTWKPPTWTRRPPFRSWSDATALTASWRCSHAGPAHALSALVAITVYIWLYRYTGTWRLGWYCCSVLWCRFILYWFLSTRLW